MLQNELGVFHAKPEASCFCEFDPGSVGMLVPGLTHANRMKARLQWVFHGVRVQNR